MKAVCIIASDNIVIDGDVCFINESLCDFDYVMHLDLTINNLVFTEKGLSYYSRFKKEMPLKVMLLYFWHMVVLRKSHVYLTGVLR